MARYFAFQWHITEECDQRCKHCYIYADGYVPIPRMTWRQMKRTLANMKEFCRFYDVIPYLYITGGDPILHPDFWRLLKRLHRHGVEFSIMGNPFHLDEEACRRMHEMGCTSYQVSIDGLKDTHDWFRMPGSYDATIASIPVIQSSGMHAIVMSTVSGTNASQMPAIVDAMVEAKADVFSFGRYCPTSMDRSIDISPEEYRTLLDELDRKYKKYEAEGCFTLFDRKDHLFTLLQYEHGEFVPAEHDGEILGCHCGRSHLTVLPNGDVLACRRFHSRIGNVFQDRLKDLWRCDLMEKVRDYGSYEKCSGCRLRDYCRGCPAVAFGTTGDFRSADPQCWRRRCGPSEYPG